MWALYHDLSPLLAELSHATTMQAIGPAMKGYETVLSSPTTKQHAEEVACYLDDECHMQIDMQRFNGP